jgi:hypothetical protein
MVPQVWIKNSFGWPLSASDETYEGEALADNDGDHAATWKEWVAGTEPNNHDSCFAITDISFLTNSQHSAVIKWHAVSDRTYKLFVNTDLNTSWDTQPADTIIGDDTDRTITFTHSSAKQLYFRMDVEFTP